MKQDKTYYVILTSILILAFAIRLLGINQPFNEDELHWAHSATVRDWFGTVTFNTPLSIYFLNAFTAIFGVSVETIRLTFIIISIATIIVTAIFAKQQYGERTALFAALLLAINPLHVLASLQAAYEGSFLTLFFVTTLFFLHKSKKKIDHSPSKTGRILALLYRVNFLLVPKIFHRQNYDQSANHHSQTRGKFLRIQQKPNKKNLILTGIAFGLSILSKSSALFIIPPIIFIYLFLTNNKFAESIKKTALITLIALFPFLIFFALPSIILQSPALINSIVKLFSPQAASSTGIVSLIIQYGYALMWLGPIFTFLPLLAWKTKKKHQIHFIAIITTILFYFILTRNTTPPIERYWMILLPSLAIISAQQISELTRISSKKILAILLLTTITSFITAFLINTQDAELLPFYPKQQYINRITDLQFDFLIPITGSSGPLGFYIHALTPLIFTVTAFLLFISILSIRKYQTTFVLFLLAISAGYQLFFIQEYLVSQTQPNIPDITKQTITYINTNDLKEPIYYFKNYALFYHFDKKYFKDKQPLSLPTKFNYFDKDRYDLKRIQEQITTTVSQSWYRGFVSLSFVDDTAEKSTALQERLEREGGTIVLIDFPTLNKNGLLWNTINKCNKIKTFTDKNKDLGHIFDCTKLKRANI